MSASIPLSDVVESLIQNGLRDHESGQLSRAEEQYRRALALSPVNFDALQLLGLARVQGGDPMAGIDLLERAAAIDPRHVGVLNNLAAAQRDRGLLREAVSSCQRALQIDPVNVTVLLTLAMTLIQVGEFRFAAKCLNRALAREPRNPSLLFGLAHLLHGTNHPREAIEAYRQAIALGLNDANLHMTLGLALEDVGDEVAASESLRKAEELAPTPTIRLYRSYAALQCAEWNRFEEDVAAFAAEPSDAALLDPMRILMFPIPGSRLRHHIQTFATNMSQGGAALVNALTPAVTPNPAASRRLRIAYLSPDFRNHAVGYLLAGVLEQHDRSRFEVCAYGWGPPDVTGLRERIVRACDRFVDVSSLSDEALVAQIRNDSVDIAVDLAVYTAHARTRVLAARVAPIQVNWLGYPGTSAGTFLDYIVVDQFVAPAGSEGQFSEEVVRLPHCYLPYDRTRAIATPRPRAEYGLPEDAVVLACLGQVRKINPRIFEAWMSVLAVVPKAVLWLASTYEPAITNLRREAQARGIAAERLIFATPVPGHDDHLARYQVADLALDTFPYGSHSTAADALWAGCPLVSLVGDSFVSRVSGSVLRGAGLPDLVSDSLEGYRETILSLATDPARRKALRSRLDAQRLSCPLFDTAGFVRSLEHAYVEMQQRVLQGRRPESFAVPASDPDGGVSQVGAGDGPQPAAEDPQRTALALVADGFKLQQQGQTAEAAALYEQALQLNPTCFDAVQLLGVLRFRSGKLDEGIELLERARTLQPKHAPTLNNLGNALRAAGRLEEALSTYRSAAANAPAPNLMILQNLGSAQLDTGDLPGALTTYGHACNIDPALLPARSARAGVALSLAHWDHFESDCEAFANGRAAPEQDFDPGILHMLPLSVGTVRRYTDAYAATLVTAEGSLALSQGATTAPAPAAPRSDRLRVAYLSADFREHAVGYLVGSLFEQHDRSRIETFAYGWNTAAPSAVRQRIIRSVEHFLDISRMSDTEVRTALVADGIDIAVDLMGYTTNSRPGIFATRAAPIQVNWLGFPGTTGAASMDYIVADDFIIPAGHESHFAEQVLRLPNTYLPYDRTRNAVPAVSRAEYGLPEDATVLVCLGQVRKINPPLFDIWMDVLNRLPKTVLWLAHTHRPAMQNLRREAQKRGVAPERLIFAVPVSDNAEHLARYRAADLALDTFPYGSHSTAADSLWMGCPLIALVGETFAARVSGSILRTAGAEELITCTPEDYRSLILQVAQDDGRRLELRARLEAQRLTCPLFDIERFTRSLERAYLEMAAAKSS